MTTKEKNNILAGIKKTGYLLEYNVSKLLAEHNWIIINSRYYVDENKEREIDILAYKVKVIDNVAYYTTLIISCKKNEENDFCVLTRDKIENDPNIKYDPNLYWTNSPILEKMYINYDSQLDTSLKNSNFKNIFEVNRHVFAFQLLKKQNKTAQNDKPIYDSIISTIKAYEYEKKSLLKRKVDKCFYNFNLISVCDANMIEIYCKNNDEQEVSYIEQFKYVNRHIIFDNEEFYRVHFIKADKFEDYLTEYDYLANFNTKFYSQLKENYYKDLLSGNDNLFNCLKKDFLSILNTLLHMRIKQKIVDVDFAYDVKNKELTLDFFGNDYKSLNKEINVNDYLEVLKSLLKEFYRYEGNFKIGVIWPF